MGGKINEPLVHWSTGSYVEGNVEKSPHPLPFIQMADPGLRALGCRAEGLHVRGGPDRNVPRAFVVLCPKGCGAANAFLRGEELY